MGWRARAEILVCISNNCDSYQKVSTAKAMENKWYQTLNMRKPRREFEMCFAPYLYLVRVAWKVFFTKNDPMRWISFKKSQEETIRILILACSGDGGVLMIIIAVAVAESVKMAIHNIQLLLLLFLLFDLEPQNRKKAIIHNHIISNLFQLWRRSNVLLHLFWADDCMYVCVCVLSCSIWSKTTPIR